MIRVETIAPVHTGARAMKQTSLAIGLNTYAAKLFDYTILDALIADRARGAAERIRHHQKAAIVDIGRELLAVKGALDHGQFGTWLEAEFAWSHSTAINYMRVAETIGDNFVLVANLSPSMIYKLAAPSTPPEVRDQVLRLGPGRTTSSHDIAKLLDEVKARNAKEKQRNQKKTPNPEELAKGERRKQRHEREMAKQEADRQARARPAIQAAQAIKHALGDRLQTIIATVPAKDYWARQAFMDELLKSATPEMEVAA